MPTVRPKRRSLPRNPETVLQERIAEITQDRLIEHIKRLVGIRHHHAAPDRLEAAADYITQQFRAAGMKVEYHRFEAFGHQNRNIIASIAHRLSAATRRLPPLILAAHYDTVSHSPGADDNASGLAVLLEAARLLGDLDLQRPLRLIAFAQEEQHCLGSTLYAIKSRRANVPIEGVIALECVGFASEQPGSQWGPRGLPVVIPDTANFLGVVGHSDATGLMERFKAAAGRYAPDLPLVSLVVPDAGHGFPDTRRSDHAPFWDAGYPALMLTDTANFRNPHYHQPGDTLETLNPSFLQQVAKAVIGWIGRFGIGQDT